MKQSFLRFISHLVLTKSKAILFFSAILTVICLIYTTHYLKLDANQDNLISKKQEYHQRYLNFLEAFGDTEYIFAVFSLNSQNREQTLLAIENLNQQLKKSPSLYSYSEYKQDLSFIKDKELSLLPEKQFKVLQSAIESFGLTQVKSIQSEADIYRSLTYAIDKFNAKQDTAVTGFDFFESAISSIKQLYDGTPLKSVAEIQESVPLYQRGFYATETDSLLFLKILPVKDYSTSAVVEKPLAELRKTISELKKQYPLIDVGITGRPVLQADEIESTGSDSLWASLGSIVGVLILYLLYLKNLKKPLLIIIALIMSLAWTSAFITLTVGRLNLLSLVFGIILVGIGVDYGMHFLIRFLSHRKSGDTSDEAIHKTLLSVGDSIITGAIATSIAFYSALFCDFLGLQELGFIAGSGVLFCLLAQIIVFPALLYLFSPQALAHDVSLPVKNAWEFIFKKPNTVLIISVLLTLLCLPLAVKVPFENNLLKLQDPNLESVIWENKILNDAGFKTYYAAITAQTYEELIHKDQLIKSLDSVSSTESLIDLIPATDRNTEIEKIATSWNLAPDTSWKIEPNAQIVSESLQRLISKLMILQEKAFAGGHIEGINKIDLILRHLNEIASKRKKLPQDKLNSVQNELGIWILDAKKVLNNKINASPAGLSMIPEEVKIRYQNKDLYVLYIYPKHNIWDWDKLTTFLTQIRTIDPHVTGAPVSVFESAKKMKAGFYLVGLLTTIIVVLLLWLETKSVTLTILSSLPLLAGLLWLLFWMALFGLSLNLGNFFALPILIGLGIDNGVHIVHCYRQTNNARASLYTVAPSIILSTATTVLGFGALAFVRHQGLSSFGMIMTLGSLTCLIAALVLLPALLQRKSNEIS